MKEGMSKMDVNIALPKFEVEYTVAELENKMTQAGMKELFTSGEAFINTVTPKIGGSMVKICHKTVFKSRISYLYFLIDSHAVFSVSGVYIEKGTADIV